MRFKKLIIVISFITLLAFIILIVNHVKASETVEVIKYDESYYENSYAVKYSDNSVYYWGVYNASSFDLVINNAKDYFINPYGILYYIDNIDNNLYYMKRNFSNNNQYIYEKTLLLENVKEISKTSEYSNYFLVLSNDNKLYIEDDYSSNLFNSLEKIEGTELYYVSDNVLDYYYYGDDILMYRTTDYKLYGLLSNIYGKKINNGNRLNNGTLILENVKSYNKFGAITNDNNFYVFSSYLSLPTKFASNVTDYYNDNALSTYDDKATIYIDTNGKYYYYSYSWDSNGNITNKKSNLLDFENAIVTDNIDGLHQKIPVLDDNTLYFYNAENNKLYKTITGIKQIRRDRSNYTYALTNSGDIYAIYYYYDTGNNLYHTLRHSYGNLSNYVKLISGVKDISYIKYNVLVMDDDTLWAYGKDNSAYRDPSASNNGYPMVIKDLPNVRNEIYVSYLELVHFDKLDFSVGDSYNYYANVLPYNASNNNITWSSSNTNVATVNQYGVIEAVGVGNAIISIETNDGSMHDEVTITVHPEPSGIVITNGDRITLNSDNNRVLLTANVLPDDTLNKEVKWVYENYNQDECYDNGMCINNYNYETDESLPSNQINVSVYKSGEYIITAKTADEKYSTTITIVYANMASSISINVDDEYIYEYNKIGIDLGRYDTVQARASIYPDDAINNEIKWESEDESIVTVSQTGLITGHKVGKCKITAKTLDNTVSRSVWVEVYNNSVPERKVGDINGDGTVDMLDLIKLRRYLAGLEDSLE